MEFWQIIIATGFFGFFWNIIGAYCNYKIEIRKYNYEKFSQRLLEFKQKYILDDNLVKDQHKEFYYQLFEEGCYLYDKKLILKQFKYIYGREIYSISNKFFKSAPIESNRILPYLHKYVKKWEKEFSKITLEP